jgi:hypothetical protein
LISTAYALHKRPVGALDVEGLRLLILQQIGLDTIVPLRSTTSSAIHWPKATSLRVIYSTP